MKKSKLITNAAILTVTGFLLRGLGMALRVYISKKLGEEGMGLYQLTQTVYFLFITIAQSGIAVALTRCLSARVAVGDERGAASLTRAALRLSLILGILSAAVMGLFSTPICKFWLGDMRCVGAVAIQSMSLPFIAVCTVLSSYFIVYGNAVFGCISQIIEQIVRVGAVAFFSALSHNPSLNFSLCSIVFAGVIAEAVSCLFLYICYIVNKKIKVRPAHSKELIKTAAPVAASRYLASLLRTIENVLVPNAITVFTKNRETALSQFGALKGMAIPLLFFPYSFLSAITTLIVPRVTGAQAKNNHQSLKQTTERVCRITLSFSVVAAGIFFTFAAPLGNIIYQSSRVTKMLLWLSPIVPFMYLDSVCDGLLKGLGKQKQVLWHNTIDSALRIVLICIFVPRFGIFGFLAVMVFSNIFISMMNFYTLCKESGVKFNIFLKLFTPICATILSSILTKFLSKSGATALNTAVDFTHFCLFFALFYAIFTVVKKTYKK